MEQVKLEPKTWGRSQRADRRNRLDELTRQASEDGLYEVDPEDYRKALAKVRKS